MTTVYNKNNYSDNNKEKKILPTSNIYAFRSTVGSTCKQVSLGVGLVHGSGDQQGTIAASALGTDGNLHHGDTIL